MKNKNNEELRRIRKETNAHIEQRGREGEEFLTAKSAKITKNARGAQMQTPEFGGSAFWILTETSRNGREGRKGLKTSEILCGLSALGRELGG